MVAANSYAVVTGAGKGLGKAFAEDLARRGINVILVSLPGEHLESECLRLANTYGINADHFEADLTRTADIEALANWLSGRYNISILINNAGFGGTGEFDTSDLELLDKMILLNVRATTWVSHKLLPLLRKNANCYILNVASMASFSPIAYKAVYAASKVYVEFLSKGLNKEFKHKGVHVSSLHPGPMPTSEEKVTRLNRHNRFGRMGVKSAEYVAKNSLDRLFKKTSVIIIGAGNVFHWVLMQTLPKKVVISLLTWGMKRELFR